MLKGAKFRPGLKVKIPIAWTKRLNTDQSVQEISATVRTTKVPKINRNTISAVS